MLNKRVLHLAIVPLLLAGFASSASARARVYVRLAPPVVVVEERGVAPGPNHIWINGNHRWDGNAYAWDSGRWEARPRAHSHWVDGGWHHHKRGYYWVDGRWRR